MGGALPVESRDGVGYVVMDGMALCSTLSNPVHFESAGLFMGAPGWIHDHRTLNSAEIILVKGGELPLRIGQSSLMLGPGAVALVPPRVEHEGTQMLSGKLTFFWAHFRLEDWSMLAVEEGLANQGDSSVVLPICSTKLNVDRLTVMFNQLLDVFSVTRPKPRAYCDCLMSAMLFEITLQMRRSGAVEGPDASRRTASLQEVYEWIRVNAFEDIGVSDVAREFNYSPSYLTARYKKDYGIGVAAQIVRFRMARACELLGTTSMGVAEVASSVGYSDAKHFMHVFKRCMGVTPSAYRATFSKRHFNSK